MANLISYLFRFLRDGLETLRRPTATCIICQYPQITSFLKNISCKKLAFIRALVYEKKITSSEKVLLAFLLSAFIDIICVTNKFSEI